jgi:hypothetical protein
MCPFRVDDAPLGSWAHKLPVKPWKVLLWISETCGPDGRASGRFPISTQRPLAPLHDHNAGKCDGLLVRDYKGKDAIGW